MADCFAQIHTERQSGSDGKKDQTRIPVPRESAPEPPAPPETNETPPPTHKIQFEKRILEQHRDYID